MGTAGVVFGAIAVLWVAYLVPWFASHRDAVDVGPSDENDRISESMRIIRRSGEGVADPTLEISTPLTRRTAMRDIQLTARQAAKRRRSVMWLLLASGAAAGGASYALSGVPWWAGAIPVGSLIVYLFVARFSVRRMARVLDRASESVQQGWEHDTIVFEVPEELRSSKVTEEFSIELTGPIETTGSLLDPIPVTAPTYVQKPLVPRTVRTIDLSAPARPVPAAPVTADAPIEHDADAGEDTEAMDPDELGQLRRASGE